MKWKSLLTNLAVPLAVGGLSALLTKDAMKEFASINQPPLAPPGWLFPVVWTILYIMMGLATYFLLQKNPSKEQRQMALRFYGVQLIFNFCWSLVFFNVGAYWFAFAWLIVLWGLIFITMRLFYAIEPKSAYLMIPYLCWVTFAGYLNAGVAFLN